MMRKIKSLKHLNIVIIQPTDQFHKNLEQILRRQIIPFAKINGFQIKRFAQALGRRVKTDKIDVKALTRFGAIVGP